MRNTCAYKVGVVCNMNGCCPRARRKKKKCPLRRRKKFCIDLECLGLNIFGTREAGVTQPEGNLVHLKEQCQRSSWISSLWQEV